jgi:hypothetical protein
MGRRRVVPLKQQSVTDLLIQILFFTGFVTFWAVSGGQFFLHVLVDSIRKPELLLESLHWLTALVALITGVVFILIPTIMILTMLLELARRASNTLKNKNQHHDNASQHP